MKKLFICLLVLMNVSVTAQNSNHEFFPKNKLLKDIYLDPFSPKISGGLYMMWENGEKKDLTLGAFAIGIHKPIFRNVKNGTKAFEIGFELSSFTQFEFYYNKVGTHKRQHLNTDFIIAMPLVWKLNDFYLRAKFFHRSTHLGDDYIFRNCLTEPDAKPITYEQADVSLFYECKQAIYYAGIGVVTRSNVERKKLNAYLGFNNFHFMGKRGKWKLTYGIHSKFEAETNFKPGVNSGIGIEFGGKEKNYPLQIMIEYYNGFMPYSAFEQKDVRLLGTSIRLKL